MILPSFFPFPKAQIFTLQTLPDRLQQPTAVLTSDRGDEDLLTRYAQQYPGQLIVQEVWKELLPDAPLLISSAICGGEVRDRFAFAAKERSCWLLIEPMRHKFPLPCPDAKGEALTSLPENTGFFSQTLCCRYTHFPGFVLLWDTEETLAQKLQLAKEAGFLGYVVP